MNEDKLKEYYNIILDLFLKIEKFQEVQLRIKDIHGLLKILHYIKILYFFFQIHAFVLKYYCHYFYF